MAKTIKFNLICDGNPVRTIEDLQNNFSVEDVLEYYDNNLLQKWLSVRGYTEELEQVNKIEETDKKAIIKELVKIFEIPCEKSEIEESVYALEHRQKENERYELYQKGKEKEETIIQKYIEGYFELMQDILNYPNDKPLIKSTLNTIAEKYEWIFSLCNREIFYKFREESILAIMCMLMNNKLRKYFLLDDETPKNGGTIDRSAVVSTPLLATNLLITAAMPHLASVTGSVTRGLMSSSVSREVNDEAMFSVSQLMKIYEITKDKAEMYKTICNIIDGNSLKKELGENLRVFSGKTEGQWKDVEPDKEKKYMIISMHTGTHIRPLGGNQDTELSEADVAHKFIIIDGIDYKCDDPEYELWYMEV